MSFDHFNPNPMATESFQQTFNPSPVQFDHMEVHNHLHHGLPHVGDRVMTDDFVIRHQFGPEGGIIGGMPEINPRF